MSDVTELARREAEAAEREGFERMTQAAEPDASEPSEGEPVEDEAAEEQEAPTEPPSDVAAERALKAIDRAGDAYTRKVQAIQRETPLGLVECPLCPVPGFVSELSPTEPDPSVVEVVSEYLGLGGTPKLRPHAYFETCPTCDGQGAVATGSKRAGFLDEPCPDCTGRGYIDTRQRNELERMAANGATGAATLPPPTYTHPSGEWGQSTITQGGFTFVSPPGGAADQFGRLPGHPLYGQPFEAGGL